jgi:YgiT-type zinc finger domain-containing protein
MKCVVCKHGTTVDGITTLTLEKNNSTIVFKSVPALVCDNCGEKYITNSISKELLENATKIVKNGVEVDIRNYQQKVA